MHKIRFSGYEVSKIIYSFALNSTKQYSMKTSKSNLKQPIIFAKIIAVSIAIFLCASCDNGNGKRLAKAKNDPAGTYREYLSDIRRQKKLSIKELTGHLKQWQTLRDSVFLYLECDTLGRLHSTVREECEQVHDSIRMEFSRMVLSGKPRLG